MVSLNTGPGALNAFAAGVRGSAYNLANGNTDGFQPVAVRYQSGRPADRGVRPLVTRPAPQATATAAPVEHPFPVSHVDEAREMVNLTLNRRSFEANAVLIRASDELIGTLIDLKV